PPPEESRKSPKESLGESKESKESLGELKKSTTGRIERENPPGESKESTPPPGESKSSRITNSSLWTLLILLGESKEFTKNHHAITRSKSRHFTSW
ncbi:294_t:CDS:2, partial [Racocetra fulgida]